MKWTSHCSVERRVDVERRRARSSRRRVTHSTRRRVRSPRRGARRARIWRRRRRRGDASMPDRTRARAARPPSTFVDAVAQVRHHRLEIGDERHVGARARDVGEVDRRPTRIASSHSGARAAHVALAARRRSDAPGNSLPPSLPTRFASATIHAVLVGDVANRAAPSGSTLAGPGTSSVLGQAPRAGGADAHEDDLRAVERGDRAGQAVPRILADEHRRASPRRVERADLAAALDEPLLVEQAVRRQEHLAMDVANRAARLAERDVHRAVVQLVVPDLVEAERDVERPRRRDGRRDTTRRDRAASVPAVTAWSRTPPSRK